MYLKCNILLDLSKLQNIKSNIRKLIIIVKINLKNCINKHNSKKKKNLKDLNLKSKNIYE